MPETRRHRTSGETENGLAKSRMCFRHHRRSNLNRLLLQTLFPASQKLLEFIVWEELQLLFVWKILKKCFSVWSLHHHSVTGKSDKELLLHVPILPLGVLYRSDGIYADLMGLTWENTALQTAKNSTVLNQPLPIFQALRTESWSIDQNFLLSHQGHF